MKLWHRPVSWVGFSIIIIAILIPLLSYFFKEPIISNFPFDLLNKIQSKKVIKPGSCLILEEKYCAKAEVADWTNPKGEKMKMIGVRLPVGTSLLMPIKGQVTKTKLPEDSPIKGMTATVFDPTGSNRLQYIFNGDLQFDNMFSINIEQGAGFGRIGNTGITNAGSYNLIFYIIRPSKPGGIFDTGALEDINRLFPLFKP